MSSNATTGSAAGDGGAAGTNKWNFGIAVVAATTLVVLTIFLVRHYKTVNDAATILGIVVPVLAAAFGATVGYTVGDTKGKADGKENAKKEVKARLAPKLSAAEISLGKIVSTIQTEGQSDAGANTFSFDPRSLGKSVDFHSADLQGAKDAISDARSAVEGL